MIALMIYAFGFVTTGVVLTRELQRRELRFAESRRDTPVESAIWATFGATVWPLLAIAWLFSRAASSYGESE